MRENKFHFGCAFMAVAVLGCAGNVIGATFTGDTSNGNWSNSGFWTLDSGADGDGIPDSDDIAIFPRPGNSGGNISLNGVSQAAQEVRFANQDRANRLHTGTLSTQFVNAVGNGSAVGLVTLSANVSQASSQLTIFSIGDIDSNVSDVAFNGVVTSTNVLKTGSGSIGLVNDANSISGTFAISNGQVIALADDNSPGNLGTAEIVLSGGGELRLRSPISGATNWNNDLTVLDTGTLFVQRSASGAGTNREHRLGTLTLESGAALTTNSLNTHRPIFTNTVVNGNASLTNDSEVRASGASGQLTVRPFATLSHLGSGELEILGDIGIVPAGGVTTVSPGASFTVVNSTTGGTLDDQTGASFATNVWAKSTAGDTIVATLDASQSLGVLPTTPGSELDTGGASAGLFEIGAGGGTDPLLLDLALGGGVVASDLIQFMQDAGLLATAPDAEADPKFDVALDIALTQGDFFLFDFSEFDAMFGATSSTGLAAAGFQANQVVPEPQSLAIWTLLGLGLAVFGYRNFYVLRSR